MRTPEDLKDRAKKIIDNLENGMTIQSACKLLGLDPKQLFRELDKDPLLRQAYMSARANRSDLYADEIIDISDNEPDSSKARNMIDARKWVASKLAPQQYGDRIDVNMNQTLDIGSALNEALKRVRKPNQLDSQTIDITASLGNGASGSQPDVPQNDSETGDAIEISEPDFLK
jgi:hypothetical protein